MGTSESGNVKNGPPLLRTLLLGFAGMPESTNMVQWQVERTFRPERLIAWGTSAGMFMETLRLGGNAISAAAIPMRLARAAVDLEVLQLHPLAQRVNVDGAGGGQFIIRDVQDDLELLRVLRGSGFGLEAWTLGPGRPIEMTFRGAPQAVALLGREV